MPMTDSARVGLTVLAAAGALGGGYLWLTGSLHAPDTYTQRVSFDNAQGVQKGAPVRVQGVDMGRVEEIALGPDRKPVLTLRIRDGATGYHVRPEDSIRIVGSLVGFTQPFIEVTPGGRRTAAVVQPDGALPGESGVNQDQILAQSDQLIRNLNQLTARMNTITDGFARVTKDGRLADDLAKTVHNFAVASDSGVVVARNMQRATGRVEHLINSFEGTSRNLNATLNKVDPLFASLRRTAEDSRVLMQDTRGVVKDTGELVRHSDQVVQNAGGLVTDTRSFIALNRQQLQEVVATLNSSLKKLDSTLTEAQGFLGDKTLQGDLKTTAANVREATENLKKITTDVRTLTGDPKVQEDLKVTVANLRDATEQAAEVFRKVRGVIGGTKSVKSIGEKLVETELKVDLLRTVESNRTRFDIDATIPWSKTTYYRAGIFDFGESNKFNIQAGQQIRPNVWARYGVHASKLGGALDFGSRNHPFFSVDLFGVDRPRADFRGNIPIAPYLDLTLGVDNAFYNADPIFGVRYRK